MRQLHAWIEAVWYGTKRAPLWLKAGVPLYWLAAHTRRAVFDWGLRAVIRVSAPVIVVGNINVGGTGKTPLLIALVEALRERGFNPGVVSRGYGSSERGPLLLDAASDPRKVGDEPCLIQRRTSVPVVIGQDRGKAAQWLLAKTECDLVLVDDGLQNPRLARDIEICVIDGVRRFGNGELLPAGPLRESPLRLRSVDFLVCNGGQAQGREVPMSLLGDAAVMLSAPHSKRGLSALSGASVHAVAGIGNPQRFFDQLQAQGLLPIRHVFPDHHPFKADDLAFGDDLPVLMTEKDAVKCALFAQAHHWVVPVRAALPNEFFDAIASRLNELRAIKTRFV